MQGSELSSIESFEAKAKWLSNRNEMQVVIVKYP